MHTHDFPCFLNIFCPIEENRIWKFFPESKSATFDLKKDSMNWASFFHHQPFPHTLKDGYDCWWLASTHKHMLMRDILLIVASSPIQISLNKFALFILNIIWTCRLAKIPKKKKKNLSFNFLPIGNFKIVFNLWLFQKVV